MARIIPVSSAAFTGTATSAAQTLAAIISTTIPASDSGVQADSVVIQCETESIRVRFDGGVPTSSVGILMSASGGVTTMDFSLSKTGIANMQIIRAGSSDATINLHFYETEGN